MCSAFLQKNSLVIHVPQSRLGAYGKLILHFEYDSLPSYQFKVHQREYTENCIFKTHLHMVPALGHQVRMTGFRKRDREMVIDFIIHFTRRTWSYYWLRNRNGGLQIEMFCDFSKYALESVIMSSFGGRCVMWCTGGHP